MSLVMWSFSMLTEIAALAAAGEWQRFWGRSRRLNEQRSVILALQGFVLPEKVSH